MNSAVCANCGTAVSGRFCGQCGTVVQTPVTSAQPQPQPQPQPANAVGQPQYPTPTPAPPAGAVLTKGLPPLGEIYGTAWSSIRANTADWVITSVLSVVLLGIVGVLFGIYVWATTKDLCESCGLTVRDPIPALDLIFFAVFVAAVVIIRLAFTRTALTIARGNKANLGGVWNPSRLLPFFVFELIAGSLWFGGWLLPFIGSIIIIAFVMYAPFEIVDRNGSGVTSIWRSFSVAVTRERVVPQLGFAFIQTVLFVVPFGIWSFLGSWLSFANIGGWSRAPGAIAAFGAIAVTGLAALIAGITVISAAAAAYVRLDKTY